MTSQPIVIAGPTREPITVDEARLFSKVDQSAEDSLFEIWIQAARQYVEDRTGHTFHEQTLEITLDTWPWYWDQAHHRDWNDWRWQWSLRSIELPRATPLIQIVEVGITGTDGVEQIWDPTKYVATTQPYVGAISLAYGASWPAVRWYPDSIRIRYRAGIAAASPPAEAPGAVKYPLLTLVSGMYDNRDSEGFVDLRATQMTAISMRYGAEAYIMRLADKVYARCH